VVFETSNMSDLQVTTKDGKEVNVGPVVGYSISNVRKYLLEAEEAEDVVVEVIGGAVFEEIHKRTWEECQKPGLAEEVRGNISRRAIRFGVKIETMYFHSLTRMGLEYGVVRVIGNGG